ncbi:MAG: branched-chain amino acid ABC transporter permease [Planctomycetota bacterium]
MLETFLQTLMDGLAVGSLYALIALGYTMVYGILKFINFAHSDVFVLGAWLSYSIAVSGGLSADPATPITPWVWWAAGVSVGVAVLMQLYDRVVFDRLPIGARERLPAPGMGTTFTIVSVWGWIAIGLVLLARGIGEGSLPQSTARTVSGGVILIAAMAACGLVGFSLERAAYKPLRKAPRLNVLITAIGVSLLLQNAGQLDWMFGTRPQGMPTLLPDLTLATFGGDNGASPVKLQLIDVVGAGTAVVLMILLDILVFRTKLGRAMRAVSFNDRNASLMGIPVDQVISFTFVLGAVLAAAAGFLFGQKYSGLNQTAAPIWVLLGLKAFVAAVVGGIGNIRGAMLGGLLIGSAEMFAKRYQSPAIADIYVFVILILVLLFKPTGLLGTRLQEKV